MRALAALSAVLGIAAACVHTPKAPEADAGVSTAPLAMDADAGTPDAAPAPADVLPGQLVVGTESPGTPESVLAAVALEGYAFEYSAAASATSHLVRVTKADGAALTADETVALQRQLSGRAGLRYVELNRLRQPR